MTPRKVSAVTREQYVRKFEKNENLVRMKAEEDFCSRLWILPTDYLIERFLTKGKEYGKFDLYKFRTEAPKNFDEEVADGLFYSFAMNEPLFPFTH